MKVVKSSPIEIMRKLNIGNPGDEILKEKKAQIIGLNSKVQNKSASLVEIKLELKSNRQLEKDKNDEEIYVKPNVQIESSELGIALFTKKEEVPISTANLNKQNEPEKIAGEKRKELFDVDKKKEEEENDGEEMEAEGSDDELPNDEFDEEDGAEGEQLDASEDDDNEEDDE